MSVNDDIRELVWLHKLWDGSVFVFDYLKEIVRGIKIHRRGQIDMSNEQDAIEKMINISREVEAEEKSSQENRL